MERSWPLLRASTQEDERQYSELKFYPEAYLCELSNTSSFLHEELEREGGSNVNWILSISPPNWEDAGPILTFVYYKYSKTLMRSLPYNIYYNSYFKLSGCFLWHLLCPTLKCLSTYYFYFLPLLIYLQGHVWKHLLAARTHPL